MILEYKKSAHPPPISCFFSFNIAISRKLPSSQIPFQLLHTPTPIHRGHGKASLYLIIKMVSKYSKTKGYKPAHVDQARMEREKAQRIQEELEAYQCLLRDTNHQPVPSHYRTPNGHHVQIVSQEGGWSRKEVSAEEQQLAPGCVWVPYPPVTRPGTAMTVQQVYLDNPQKYWCVQPLEVGFNDLGEFTDEEGARYRSYQLRQLMVIEIAPGVFDYEVVTATNFDPFRDQIRVYECGRTVCVAPIPEEFRHYFSVTPVPPQPVPIQQMPGLGFQQPMLGPAPQQMSEPQMLLDGSNSTPDSGLSFNSAAVPTVSSSADLANGASQEDEKAVFNIFDLSSAEVFGADFGNGGDMLFE